MAYQFLAKPKYVTPDCYEKTVDKIVELLKKENSIQAIYRLGNVNHPGISDIDIIVIFKNGSSCELNPREFLNADDKYLLTHEVFGASEEQFKKVIHYSFWDNLTCIWGEPLEWSADRNKLSEDDRTFYKTQVGLEFLLKNYIELSIQRKYGVIKLRSLIQEIKGVRYDLDFLNIQGLKINECMTDFLCRLDHWFESPFRSQEFSAWLNKYYIALVEAINHVNLQGKILWVPKEKNLTYGRNIFLHQGEQLQLKTSGIFLPSFFISKSKKVYNAHQRLNRFELTLNYNCKEHNQLNRTRFNAFQAHKRENQERFPHFGPLLTSFVNQLV